MKLKNEKKTKKIMFVTPYFYPKVGGLENYAYNIALGLKDKYNWEIVIVTSNHEKPREYKEEVIKGMKVYRLPRLLKISNTPINPMWYWQIKKIIKKENPDIINGHAPVPFIADVAARLANSMKIPFVLTYHAGSMKKDKFLPDLLIYPYEKIFLEKTKKIGKKIISSSEFVKNNFIKSEKASVITPGVNVDVFKPNNKENKIGNILFVGSLNKGDKHKMLITLLEAFELIKKEGIKNKLVIVGEGDNINFYKSISKKIGISRDTIFKGKLEGKKLVEEYQKSDLLVLPSINDSFGMVLIEAMACGKPVVGSKIGGIPYVIENGVNGILFSPKDSKSLANAALKLINNKKLSKKMGKNGYKKVEKNFTWKIKINETHKEFMNLKK